MRLPKECYQMRQVNVEQIEDCRIEPPPSPSPPSANLHPQALRNHLGSQLVQQQVEPAPARSPLLFGFQHCPHLSLKWTKWAF